MMGIVYIRRCIYLCFLLCACACKKPQHHASLLTMVPSNAEWVVWTPDAGVFFTSLEGFLERSITPIHGRQVSLMRAQIKEQWGFDPFIAAEWERIGVRSKSGWVVFKEPTKGDMVWLVEAFNQETLQKTFQTVSTQVRGALEHSTSTLHQHRLTTATVPFGEESVPVAHMLEVGLYTFFAEDKKTLEILAQQYNRRGIPHQPQQTLAQNSEHLKTLKHISSGTLYAYGHTSHTSSLKPYAFSSTLSAQGFSADYWTPFSGTNNTSESLFQKSVQPYMHPKPFVSLLTHNPYITYYQKTLLSLLARHPVGFNFEKNKQWIETGAALLKNDMLVEWFPTESPLDQQSTWSEFVSTHTGFHAIFSTENIPDTKNTLKNISESIKTEGKATVSSYGMQVEKESVQVYLFKYKHHEIHTAVHKNIWVFASTRKAVEQWFKNTTETTLKQQATLVHQGPSFMACMVKNTDVENFFNTVPDGLKPGVVKKAARFLHSIQDLSLTGLCTNEQGCTFKARQTFK